MRSSYASHYRRMLAPLLSVLEFRSNNAAWRPVLNALDWIRRMQDSGRRFVPQEDVQLKSSRRNGAASIIDASGRVNRISYELCVLSQLRERIRAKEIWVVGADPLSAIRMMICRRISMLAVPPYYSSLNLTQDARGLYGRSEGGARTGTPASECGVTGQ